jgi:hypothetical protein
VPACGFGNRLQIQRTVKYHQIGIGRNDINPVGLHPHAVPGLNDRDGCGAAEQVHQHAFMGGLQMLNEDEGHARCWRQGFQQFLESFVAAGRGADADDHERVLYEQGDIR